MDRKPRMIPEMAGLALAVALVGGCGGGAQPAGEIPPPRAATPEEMKKAQSTPVEPPKAPAPQ